MAWTTPYKANNYLGEIANTGGDAEALAVIRANEFDSTNDGTGDPQNGMWYYDSTNDKLRAYQSGAWTDVISESNIEDGSADGELAYWDNGAGEYKHSETSEIVWDDTNKRLGIGEASPDAALHVSEADLAEVALLERSGTTSDGPWTAARLLSTKTTDMANGFGSGVECAIRDDGDVVRGIVWIGGVKAGTDDQTGDIVFRPYTTGSAGEMMRITHDGKIGLYETEPETSIEISHQAPIITLHNTTHEDSDGGREGAVQFYGEQSGGEESTLAKIEASHSGSSDDQKGQLEFRVNDGSDGDSPTLVMTLNDDKDAIFNGCAGVGVDPVQSLHVHNTGTSYIHISNSNTGSTATDGFDIGYYTGQTNLAIVNRENSDIQIFTNATEYMTIKSDGKILFPAVYSDTVTSARDLEIQSDGQIGYVSSALRYKEDVESIDDSSWLHDLRPVTFRFKANPQHREYGLIAEEVEQVNSDFVFYNDEELIEGVHYKKLIPVLLHEIQALKKKIDSMK